MARIETRTIPDEPAEDDGPDGWTAPLSGGPLVLDIEQDLEVLADAEEEADDD